VIKDYRSGSSQGAEAISGPATSVTIAVESQRMRLPYTYYNGCYIKDN